MKTPNRIVMPAIDMTVSEDGEIGQGEIDHYVARAGGGAGPSITGACAIALPDGAASVCPCNARSSRSAPAASAEGLDCECLSALSYVGPSGSRVR